MSAPARRLRIRPWMIGTAALMVVVGVGAATTTYRSISDVASAAEEAAFDPAEYAKEHFEKDMVPQIEKEAVDLSTLLTDLEDGADQADYGNAPGAGSSFSFPVTFTATVGEIKEPVAALTIDGVDSETTVQLQVGPALNGTALRDVTGTVDFNDFTNQLEFQNVATELNNIVRDTVLADTTIVEGDTVTVTGAFTRVNPKLVSVVPVDLEVMP